MFKATLILALAIAVSSLEINQQMNQLNQATQNGKRSNRVNLLSQAIGARMLAANDPKGQFNFDQNNGFVPIARSNPPQMMNTQFTQQFSLPEPVTQAMTIDTIPVTAPRFKSDFETTTQVVPRMDINNQFNFQQPPQQQQQQFFRSNLATTVLPVTTPLIQTTMPTTTPQRVQFQVQQQQQQPVQQQRFNNFAQGQLVQQQQPQQPRVDLVTPAMPVVQQQPIGGGQVDICKAAQPGDIIAHPSNVNQFVICYGFGEFTIMDCPEHLVYNSHLVRCDLETVAPAGCASNPCMNNGRCTDLPNFQFKCECPAGFAGLNCEKVDACVSRPCGDGSCITMAPGSPVPNMCICQAGRGVGQTCASNLEANPCMSPGANFRVFPTRVNHSMFIQCEGFRPHFKFCQFPLIFNPQKQACDWN